MGEVKAYLSSNTVFYLAGLCCMWYPKKLVYLLKSNAIGRHMRPLCIMFQKARHLRDMLNALVTLWVLVQIGKFAYHLQIQCFMLITWGCREQCVLCVIHIYCVGGL